MDNLKSLIDLALEEDIGTGDVTTGAVVPHSDLGKATIKAKQDLILAGLTAAKAVFQKVDPGLTVQSEKNDGDFIGNGELIAEVFGPVGSILKAERTALNFLQHLSGVATMTALFVQEIEGTKAKILDTRKTLPGYRALEKEAVKLGGGQNHRMGLFDMFLIKDNHISAAGSIKEAVKRAKEKNTRGLKIEVEVKNMAELDEALASEVDIIMLDNFKVDTVAKAVKTTAGRVKLEASGNIGLENIRAYAETGVDYISVGAITHSAPAADISMLITC